MLVFGKNFRYHRRWVASFVVGTVAAIATFASTAALGGGPPGGGTRLGLFFGTAAALIFLFECALVARKYSRRKFGPPVRVWMKAHIWLGLFCVPLVVLHAGGPRVPGGALPLLLTTVFFVVILSGAGLLWYQQYLPRRITSEVPAETLLPQIDDVMRIHTERLARRIDDVCGWPATGALASAVVGYATTEHSLGRKLGEAEPPEAEIPGSEPIRQFFLHDALAYLLHGCASRSPLASPAEARLLFQQLRTDAPNAGALVTELENLCARRREFDHQRELDAKLHRWRIVHIPLSVLLIVLTLAHAITALHYW
jgi:hypothetical protein